MHKYIIPASRGSGLVKECKIPMSLILIRYYTSAQSKAVFSFKNEGTAFGGIIISYVDIFGSDANMKNPTALALYNLWKFADKMGQASMTELTEFA